LEPPNFAKRFPIHTKYCALIWLHWKLSKAVQQAQYIRHAVTMRPMLVHDLHEDVLSDVLTYCDIYTVVSFSEVMSHIRALTFPLTLILRSADTLESSRCPSSSGAH
jgi:hypothetical protein